MALQRQVQREITTNKGLRHKPDGGSFYKKPKRPGQIMTKNGKHKYDASEGG